jgi:hypothetical protein
MIVNFRVREISQGACKLARTSTLIKRKEKKKIGISINENEILTKL